MSSTQEKLEEIQATKVKSNKTRSGYEITLDPEYLTDLINSAKREGAIEELKKLPSSRHESSGWCNAEFFIDSQDRWDRIKQLEQSEEKIYIDDIHSADAKTFEEWNTEQSEESI